MSKIIEVCLIDDLESFLDQDISTLTRFGLSEVDIFFLKTRDCVRVEDLATAALDDVDAALRSLVERARLAQLRRVFFGAPSPHAMGQCKPCAWFHHIGGCHLGSVCVFCHICPPGELKRRKKSKKSLTASFDSATTRSSSI
jgi:hypothetical protein